MNAVAMASFEVNLSLSAPNVRDPRAFNRMDAETKLIHARLEEWANETKRFMEARGYPRESYYHKWAALGIAPNPGHEPEMSQRAANVDGAVTKLGVIDKSVIWRYYMQWRPVGIWKQLSGIESEHKFNIVLKRARWRVDGYLSAIEVRG